MEEKNLYFLILGLIILSCPVLSITTQQVNCQKVAVEQISIISQDIGVSYEREISGPNSGNTEVKISILRKEICIDSSKSLKYPYFIKPYFIAINTQNQISIPDTPKFVTNYQCTSIFSGVFLI